MLFIILVLILSIPYVQTRLGKYATERLNEEYNTHIYVNRLSMQINGDIELKDIYIEDYKKNTLFSAAELNTSILSVRNLFNGNLVFGDVDIENLHFNVKTYEGERETNLDIFVKRFERDNPEKVRSEFLLSSSDVSIYNSVFSLADENRETSKMLYLNDLNINGTNLLIDGSNVSTRINTLSFVDSRGVVVKNMMTNFAYTLSDMTFANLQIKTENSVLNGDLKFLYKREDLQYFTDKVNIEASFKGSNVLLDELNRFYDEFGQNIHAKFDVDLSGTLNNLKMTGLRLSTSDRTHVDGDILFRNLFNAKDDNFYMNGKFRSLSSTYSDLTHLLPGILGRSIPSSFDRVGMFNIMGNTVITSKKVVADIKIFTDIGFVDSNLEIDKINDIDNGSYKGNIIVNEFDFGSFLNAPKVGKGSLNIDVNGKGFTAEKIDTQIKGDIFQLEYNNYNYEGIKIAGNVMNNIFDGNLMINDSNLKMNFLGLVDFSEEVKKYDFEAVVDYADLQTLNFIKRDSISILKSKVNMNMNAGSVDDAFGKIIFSNTVYENENDTYAFDKFVVTSRFEGEKRYLSFNSPDIIQGDLNGRFVLRDLQKLFKNAIGYDYSNYTRDKVVEKQYIDFNFKIYNKIVEVLYPEVKLAKNTFIRGRVESDESKFKLMFKSPKIEYDDYFVDNVELQVDNDNPLFDTYIEADSLNTKFYNLSKFNLINVTLNDTLFMRAEIVGGKRNDDNFNLNFYHTINDKNESVVGFKKSNFTIKNHKWHINEIDDNFHKIVFDKKLAHLRLEKFKVNHEDEIINLSGFIKDSTQKDIKLDFVNIDLDKILPELDSLKFEGRVNGQLEVLQENGSYLPSSEIVVNGLKINEFDLGSFDAKIKGNESLTNYQVDASIKNDLAKSFHAQGEISVVKKQAAIDVNLDFDDFKLDPLNALLQGVLSNIRGEATGRVQVVGNLKEPEINGKLLLNKAGLGIPYLNVDYAFAENSSVGLNNQTFQFNNIKITDTKYQSKGVFKGTISHENFSKWNLGLDITTDNLVVLDTKEEEESLYFGTGFLGGRASIYGPTEQLVINVIGETKKGTVFNIPLSDSESFGDNSYMRFITKEEKMAKEQGVEIVFKEIKGLELDFDLDVTEDAEVQLIIDKSTGHSLKGRGSGGLLVEINTNGKFNMWGDFSVFEGVYNFAYGGLVQKEFIVQPGGTIAWEGDPLKAQIDMLATYKTRANPSPLLDTPINRSIPVELNIALVGDLEQPEPEFSFEFPNVNSTVKSELNYRLQSKEDKQNQALYLLSTASFSSGLSDLNFSGTIAERLNGIINGFFTGEDSKLNIGLNYESGQNRPDYQTDDRFGVTLQTQISDRVIINGKVGVPVGGSGATQSVVAGDVEIAFLLNEDGNLTANVFNRENSIRNFGEKIGYTQGIGVAYSVDFDTFRELIQEILKKSESVEVDIEAEKAEDKKEKVLPNYISIKEE
ncbi:translocation/assembly module TamB domain-containing protein [Tamlana sp. 2_MG-2023]|uniref:translocation/assembly module TamB domain-containing protein n=1 Tax=unclassified Tamlana TaxID=2614803 RepID=UPI0026E395EA|nr:MULTISPECIES: translocation/assembly module TamB [unclassified Tamlana]MDO6759296.1 translocation/assembly module TamB domain-containing protein [Tamlana sp. 2_MG-2023]MDO6790565.1 translocation/assembly module TamB domain-containing protein [Tamlana sp. 1_MG-2023]